MVDDSGTKRMPAPAGPDEPTAVPPAEPRRDDRGHPPKEAVLVVSRGPQAGKQIELRRARMVLGRSAECDIVLDDVTVSRRHAEIGRESGRYVVTDAGSLNGTYINRNPVHGAAVLNDGDELRVGIFRMIFRG